MKRDHILRPRQRHGVLIEYSGKNGSIHGRTRQSWECLKVADRCQDSVAREGRCTLLSCSSSVFPVLTAWVFFPHRTAWDSTHRLFILREICGWEGSLQPVRPGPVWTMYIYLLGLRCLGLYAVWPCRVSSLIVGLPKSWSLLGGHSVGTVCHHVTDMLHVTALFKTQ